MTSLFVSRAAQAACLVTLCGASAFAGIITFTGEDLNAGPGATFSNSNSAAASFTSAASAIGSVGTITFETAPQGAFTNLNIAPGVTASGPSGLSILNAPSFPSNPSLDGFNTTPGGLQYIEDKAGTITFNFAAPTQFFGAYLSGLQNYYAQDLITFTDGTTELINAPETGTGPGTGAVDFVGFTDASKLISSIAITSATPGTGTDYIGIDDVEYETGTVTPEPASIWLALIAFVGLFVVGSRVKSVRRV